MVTSYSFVKRDDRDDVNGNDALKCQFFLKSVCVLLMLKHHGGDSLNVEGDIKRRRKHSFTKNINVSAWKKSAQL